MELNLVRSEFTDKSTIGDLSINGEWFCFTLEDMDRHLEDGGIKVYGETAIPRGRYQVIIDFSARFNRLMPLVCNVPQFDGIRIHPGNTEFQTAGCLLVGATKGVDFIGESKDTFDRFYPILADTISKGEEIWITVS